VRASVTPKTGDKFLCDSGATLDGQRVTAQAFISAGGNPDSVTIRGCRITNYNPPMQMAMIEAALYGGSDLTTGWVIENNEIDHSTNVGVKIGTSAIARGNYIHHNGRLGIGGGGIGSLVENNEIAYNHLPGVTDPIAEAGGSKFAGTTDLIVRGNFVHHNLGPGLWTDINNYSTLYENNRVEDNAGCGICHEISYKAVIRNNQVRRNGFGGATWLINVNGIEIAASSDVEVYGNVIEGNNVGLSGVQQNRGTGNRGPWLVQNLYVHDNTFIRQTGAEYGGAHAVLASDDGSDLTTATRNNRWRNNTYVANCTLPRWHWRPAGATSGFKTFAQWQAAGQDVSGSCTP
jgi:parallel beta-helix repeat protein